MCYTCEREKTWFRIRAYGLDQMISWEIYDIITHDPSSHVNVPLDLPEQCDISMHQQSHKWHNKEE
jgi:hypothetical protein